MALADSRENHQRSYEVVEKSPPWSAPSISKGIEQHIPELRALSIGLWSYVSRPRGRCRCADAFRI